MTGGDELSVAAFALANPSRPSFSPAVARLVFPALYDRQTTETSTRNVLRLRGHDDPHFDLPATRSAEVDVPLVTSWRARLLNRAFRNTSYTGVTQFKWAPFSSSPDADGTGGSEISTGGAARRSFTFGTPLLGQISSAGDIEAVSEASGDWAAATHFAVFATVGGVDEMLFYGPTTPARLVLTGDSWTLLAGQVQYADIAESADEFLSYFTVNALLSQLAGASTPSWPATVYAALLTAPHDRFGTGGAEVSGAGYARKAMAFAAPSSGVLSPSAAIDFGTAGGSWGLVTHLAFYDASTGGNLMAQVAFSSAVQVVTGSPVNIPAAQTAITLS